MKTPALNYQLVCPATGERLALNKSKMLLGRAAHCELHIDDAALNQYHALLSVQADGVLIIDLDSVNGLYINGKRVQERALLLLQDQLQINQKSFYLEELVVTAEAFAPDLDLEVKALKAVTTTIAPMPSVASTDRERDDAWVYVDGEFCRIVFDESQAQTQAQGMGQVFAPEKFQGAYENLESMDTAGSELISVPIPFTSKNSKTNSGAMQLEVAIMHGEHLVDLCYLPLEKKQRQYRAQGLKHHKRHNKFSINLDFLPSDFDQLFLECQKQGSALLHALPGMDYYNDGQLQASPKSPITLMAGSQHSFTQGPRQVSVSLVEAPEGVMGPMFWQWEKAELKRQAAGAGTFLLLLLIMLNLDIPELQPEQKPLAIIYRQAPVASQNQAAPGAGAEAEAPKVAETKAPESAAPKAAKKVTQQAAPTAAAEAKPTKPNYELKLNNSLTSFFSDKTPSLADSKPSGQPSPGAPGASAFALTGSTGSGTTSGTGKLGKLSDSWGSGGAGAGAGKGIGRGLGSKQGIDTALVSTETVVLGSIDPELLKKILREHLPQFRYCYQQEIERHQNIKGMLDLNFRIEADGSVSVVDIKGSSEFSGQGTNCMGSVLKRIQFPKPKGGGIVDVRQPLNFQAEKARI